MKKTQYLLHANITSFTVSSNNKSTYTGVPINGINKAYNDLCEIDSKLRQNKINTSTNTDVKDNASQLLLTSPLLHEGTSEPFRNLIQTERTSYREVPRTLNVE